ncbi:hypothetical protein NG702_12360 [Pseudarthrobacter sp. MDT3-28]|uniref:hypothetical protein n=1 Tax=Pseudarthrobacter raffinosi TaxID=2953651 RepID=UPI00208E38A9|nr:hypothetical protein [Pseudarthrobacter sp. MDT3-28]MCO4238197.1 hypothetical protein [Pseudarthrobacter sp. MDT3-28]
MTIDNDDANTPAPTDSQGTDAAAEVSRGWFHIGAIIVDATLQRRQNYNETVKPRVEALVADWPDAATTSGFRQHLDTGKLSEVIDWPSPGRLAQIEDITQVFEREGIETVAELRGTLEDHIQGAALREALALVRHVSPKTLDYIGTLSGISTGAAADRAAGVEDLT